MGKYLPSVHQFPVVLKLCDSILVTGSEEGGMGGSEHRNTAKNIN